MNISEATWLYVSRHATDDVCQLALQGSKDSEVDMTMALQLIEGRQMARHKLPSWAAVERIVYPPHLSMEQCSSEATALYKERLVSDLFFACQDAAESQFIDLTGGLGVDISFMSRRFSRAVYVEQQAGLCAIATENFKTLGLDVTTVCSDASDYLRQMDHATLIYLDPARRDSRGARTFGIADCTPNVLLLLDELLQKADYVLLKLSPMLDWRKAMSDVGLQHVEQVHILSVDNECKELLLLLSAQGSSSPQLFCVNNEQIETFRLDEPSPYPSRLSSTTSHASFSPSRPSSNPSSLTPLPSLLFLYEPNASLMKAGMFDELAVRYGVMSLSTNSHLFMSAERVEGFPGRSFEVVDVSTMNKNDLKAKVLPLRQANIAVRNFPLTVAELRKRLKLSEGGSKYLFATTLAQGERVLFVTRKLC